MNREGGAETQHDLGELLGMLGAVVFHADPETLQVQLVGAHAAASLGLPADGPALSASFWERVIPEAERARLVQTLRDVAADGAPRVLEHRVLLPGREDVFFRTAVRRLPGEGRATPRLLGAMLDISRERASERQWRELEAWLAALGEGLPFDFWICDRLGRVVLQNPVSTQHWGDMVGRGPEQVPLPPEAKAAWQRNHARALAGEVVHEELELVLGGEPRTVARVVAPVRQDGQVCGSLCVDMDVTPLKHVEQRLRQSLEELGRTQEALVRREQLVALGEMAALVAHEVRNPLGAMCNVIALLRRREPASGQNDELLWILEEESQRLDELVSNLLELVRPQDAVLRLQPLWPVVEEALTHALRATGSGARIQLVRRTVDSSLEAALDTRLL
ncbi:MAG: PAS domain-containing protein, partial [Myxococcaceae bacterium]|nr:PAS domain-containing protein [Myxococcaceae bacterium]